MCNLTFCSWKCIGNIRNASNYKVNFMEILILYTVMSLGNILFEHSVSNRKEIRVIESINRKLINGKAALSFNEHCHNNNLLPSYTNIYITRHPIQKLHPITAAEPLPRMRQVRATRVRKCCTRLRIRKGRHWPRIHEQTNRKCGTDEFDSETNESFESCYSCR